MKAKIKIYFGRFLLMKGEITAAPKDYENASGLTGNAGRRYVGTLETNFSRFCEDLFAMEQAINASGKLRCHIEEPTE